MKINEIIVENDVGDVVDLSKQNVSKGYSAVSKLLSPSRWFEKGKDVKLDKKPSTGPSSNSLHLNRQSVTSAGSGNRLYPDDIQRLKVLNSRVLNGKVNTGMINAKQLSDALKAAINGQADKNQQTLLVQFSKQL